VELYLEAEAWAALMHQGLQLLLLGSATHPEHPFLAPGTGTTPAAAAAAGAGASAAVPAAAGTASGGHCKPGGSISSSRWWWGAEGQQRLGGWLQGGQPVLWGCVGMTPQSGSDPTPDCPAAVAVMALAVATLSLGHLSCSRHQPDPPASSPAAAAGATSSSGGSHEACVSAAAVHDGAVFSLNEVSSGSSTGVDAVVCGASVQVATQLKLYIDTGPLVGQKGVGPAAQPQRQEAVAARAGHADHHLPPPAQQPPAAASGDPLRPRSRRGGQLAGSGQACPAAAAPPCFTFRLVADERPSRPRTTLDPTDPSLHRRPYFRLKPREAAVAAAEAEQLVAGGCEPSPWDMCCSTLQGALALVNRSSRLLRKPLTRMVLRCGCCPLCGLVTRSMHSMAAHWAASHDLLGTCVVTSHHSSPHHRHQQQQGKEMLPCGINPAAAAVVACAPGGSPSSSSGGGGCGGSPEQQVQVWVAAGVWDPAWPQEPPQLQEAAALRDRDSTRDPDEEDERVGCWCRGRLLARGE
jgi:hypothetical protein